MTTHILNIGYAAGQTLTAQRFALNSDTIIETTSTVAEATNRKGRYNLSFTDVAAGDYLIVYFVGAVGVGSEYATFAGVDAEVVAPWSESKPLLSLAASLPVTRSVSDTTPITFSWPVSSATITVRRSINNANYVAAAGAVSFLRTEAGKHYYVLAFDAADRPTDPGTARYEFIDGTYTRFVTLTVNEFEGGGGGGSSLTGPFTRTITITDSVSGDPIEGVSVRLSLAADTESQLTNASGVVSYTVSAGTWSYEVFRSGYAGASGTVVVSGSGGTAVALVANNPAPPVNPNNATLRVTCIGEDSQIEPGAIVMIRMIEAPASQVGFGYDGTAATFTADANGIAEREVARGATYEIRREGTYKQWQQYVMPTDQDLILITSFVQP